MKFDIKAVTFRYYKYDSLQDLGQELLPNSSIFKVHRNYKIDSRSYVKFCQEFHFKDKNAQAIFV